MLRTVSGCTWNDSTTDVAPSEDELHALLHTVIARLMKMRTRRAERSFSAD